jgi:hypothetical protein
MLQVPTDPARSRNGTATPLTRRRILVNGQWYASAVLVNGTSRIGKMPKVVTAQGPTEPAVLVEIARWLVAYSEGGVPR